MNISLQTPNFLNNYKTTPRKAPSFGIKMEPGDYHFEYKRNPCHNGLSSDEFIISRLIHYFPNSKGVKVLDIGAGQGRNAVSVAEEGYVITALEINPLGQEQCKRSAERKGVKHKLDFSCANILDDWEQDEKYDFAFMANVAQHLNSEELEKTLANVNKCLKPDGALVFDALTLKGKKEKIFKNYHDWAGITDRRKIETNGSSYFKDNEEISGIAAKNGFKLIEVAPYKEVLKLRPPWVSAWQKTFDQHNWYVLKKIKPA